MEYLPTCIPQPLQTRLRSELLCSLNDRAPESVYLSNLASWFCNTPTHIAFHRLSNRSHLAKHCRCGIRYLYPKSAFSEIHFVVTAMLGRATTDLLFQK